MFIPRTRGLPRPWARLLLLLHRWQVRLREERVPGYAMSALWSVLMDRVREMTYDAEHELHLQPTATNIAHQVKPSDNPCAAPPSSPPLLYTAT